MDADWHAICQAIFKGIEGEECKEAVCYKPHVWSAFEMELLNCSAALRDDMLKVTREGRVTELGARSAGTLQEAVGDFKEMHRTGQFSACTNGEAEHFVCHPERSDSERGIKQSVTSIGELRGQVRLYCKYVELHKAVNLKKPGTSQKAKALWSMRDAKTHGEAYYDRSDNDNDNDTLREVPHPSNEGLALQARVSGS